MANTFIEAEPQFQNKVQFLNLGDGTIPTEYEVQTEFGAVTAELTMGDTGANLHINNQDIEIKDNSLNTKGLHQEIAFEVNGQIVTFIAYWLSNQPNRPVVLLPQKQENIAA